MRDRRTPSTVPSIAVVARCSVLQLAAGVVAERQLEHVTNVAAAQADVGKHLVVELGQRRDLPPILPRRSADALRSECLQEVQLRAIRSGWR